MQKDGAQQSLAPLRPSCHRAGCAGSDGNITGANKESRSGSYWVPACQPGEKTGAKEGLVSSTFHLPSAFSGYFHLFLHLQTVLV